MRLPHPSIKLQQRAKGARMPSDASLYGVRKPKSTTKEISSSTTLAFTSQLSSLLASSTSSSRTSSGRTRPSSKPDLFTTHNKNSKKRALRDLEDESGLRHQKGRQDIGGVDLEVLHRSKRKMEEKARLYAAMKRGDYVPGEGEPEALIDFDRKWAENERQGGAGNEIDTSSDDGADDSDDGNGRDEEKMVEYEDEYGRQRRGIKAEADKMARKKRNQILGQQELEKMSARPAMPAQLIYGDTVQSLAFSPDEPIVQQMEALAAKRDRSATPPEAKHYEADKEVRSKGVGFYAFSKDEAVRKREMEALERERAETERMRVEREERKANRRLEVEARRKEIGEKRARKQADSFLDGLTADLAANDAGNT